MWRPRATLTSQACDSMRRSSLSLMMPSVSGVSASASTTRSAPARPSVSRSLSRTTSAPSIGWARFRTTVTWQSKGWSILSSDNVMPPPPTMVARPPWRLVPCGGLQDEARP